MASLPVEILLGIYLGLLVGMVPALISWALGFVFKYVTNVTLPGFGVAVLAIALAGVNGGLLAIADRSITGSPNAPRVITAIVVVSMTSMYAHNRGDNLGATLPKRLSLSDFRPRTLSKDFADLIGSGDEVRIRVVGEVADMEGYPPLSEELRADLRNAELTFPADLRLDELEDRMADRLTTEHDLGDVSVSIDERGRATVVAAPPFSGLSKRIGDNRHAVSVSGLVPTGLARGDEVTVITSNAQVRGTVVSANTGDSERASGDEAAADAEPLSIDGADDDSLPKPVRAPTTDGGEGRVTVAVTRTDVQPLLRADRAKVVVESRGTRREYEVISLLRRADKRFRRYTVRAGSALAGRTLGTAGLRDAYGVVVFAVRTAEGWVVAPRGETTLEEGDELFAVGTRDELESFSSAASTTDRVPGGDD
ncbi:potassium channel family protein [Salinibaculum rarum]|uniref:potassium channel family protein n=1 Tax=Salinibaculum rarum TaxID=3058903 RepID=UPI00265F6B28|nr:TrkA C-terminal domain-containing protein [Salinibaculum sp. KK48]